MHTPHWAIEQYERGNLNETEKFLLLTQAITEENTVGFVTSLTRELLREVKEYIDGCPHTDEGWSKWRIFRIVSCVRPPSAEEVEAERLKKLRLHRRGVEILRDVVGPPLFGELVIAPELLVWRAETLPKLARAIYNERRWGDLPIRADALEEAGCDCEEIVSHCRSGGEHYRGCWAVDLLLGTA